jgi:hypothetical protein
VGDEETGQRYRFIKVDTFVFRVSATDDRESADLWRDTRWVRFPMTSREVSDLWAANVISLTDLENLGIPPD